MNREEWMKQAYLWLCKFQGDPENDKEKHNMWEWAVSLTEDFYDPAPNDYTPEDAVREDLSYAT